MLTWAEIPKVPSCEEVHAYCSLPCLKPRLDTQRLGPQLLCGNLEGHLRAGQDRRGRGEAVDRDRENQNTRTGVVEAGQG